MRRRRTPRRATDEPRRYGIGLSSRAVSLGFVVVFVVRVEAPLLGAERPGQVQQLPRGGTPGDLGRLPGRAQALMEGLDGRVVAGGAERRHVERGPQSAVAVMANPG